VQDAEDLYQETLLKGYNYWDKFELGTNFRAWMSRIMINTHINNVNKNKRKMECDFSNGECENIIYHALAENAAHYAENPEKVFMENHIDHGIERMLYSLPDTFRMPFSLFHFEGYLYEEVAKILDLPIGTVKSRIFRARKMMKDMIESKTETKH
jgi:RNA polymerase sigma-70 factor (ECF subfamily)